MAADLEVRASQPVMKKLEVLEAEFRQASATKAGVEASSEPDQVPEPGAPATEEKKKKKKKQAPTCFESTPAPSMADVGHGRAAGDMPETPSVFESRPAEASRADTTAAVASLSSERRAEEARALIEASLTEECAAGVFESQPSETNADAGTTRQSPSGHALTESLSVFESQPAPSRADVAHGGSSANRAADAQALIQSALETMDTQPSVYESQPVVSAATDASYTGAADAADYPSTFESRPVVSNADVSHAVASSASARGEEAAQVIQRGADELLRAESAGVFESTPAPSLADTRAAAASRRSAEAYHVIATAASAHEAGDMSGGRFTFESVPQRSTAAVRHGEAVVDDDEWEYETDDEA